MQLLRPMALRTVGRTERDLAANSTAGSSVGCRIRNVRVPGIVSRVVATQILPESNDRRLISEKLEDLLI